MARRYRADRRGAAAVEFALWTSLLTLPILNAADLGVYAFQEMELNNATQAAAQAAWSLCNKGSLLPAATNCTGLQTTLATAAHSTTLGTSAALQASAEGYYCLNTSGVLTLVGTAGAIPTSGTGTAPTGKVSNCSSDGANFTGNTQPSGDYVLITVHYTYKPLFSGLSILSILPSTMSRTAWMRLA